MPSAPGDPGISRLISTTLSIRSAPGAGAPGAGASGAGASGAGAPGAGAATLADALFASALQRSDHPAPGQVRQAIAAAAAAYGGYGCAARVAQAFGEHPETAVTRMRWARALAARVVPAACLAA